MSHPRSRCPHVATIGSITDDDYVKATEVSVIGEVIAEEHLCLVR